MNRDLPAKLGNRESTRPVRAAAQGNRRSNRLLALAHALAVVLVSGQATRAAASAYDVYAVEYNQSTNRFGTINLLNGTFTKISSIGSTKINDIAWCPTNGLLYGISNTTSLVIFNTTNGTMTSVAKMSVSGIQSLAFRYKDGALFGATQSKLYVINPTNGAATLVGSYGTPSNLGSSGQNIRFAADGNLYVSNTSTNTDIYRINTANGAATWMGEVIGCPYLMLQNGSSNMYGVYIKLGTSTNATPKLASFDLSSFVINGTNANGSIHPITYTLVGPGTNFPPNFNFSGSVPAAVTNLTVPVSATALSNQTVVAGSTVVFSTTASGTGPYTYTWSVSGQTNSSLILSNVTTANAGTYTVIVAGAMGSVTNSATLTVTKASGSIVLGSLSQVYSSLPEPATATTIPAGLAVTLTYNGSAAAPVNAGSYTVVGTINDANYRGSATNTLTILPATLTYSANPASLTYGSAMPALSGSVSGFLGADNQANATMGHLTFSTTATSTSGVNTYPVTGGGLTANSGNYTFVQAAGNASALNIKPLPVLLTGTRAYDATTAAAAGILTVANKVGSDNVMLTSGNATLAAANVGSQALISVGDLALGGSAAGNYTLSGAGGSVNITVSVVALTVTNLLALDKTYDGTTNAALDATGAGLAGVFNGDDVSLVTSNAVAAFADKNVATNKPVTVTGLALGGAAAPNYTLAIPTNLAADIAPAGLTVTGLTAVSRTYDAGTNAQLAGIAGLDSVVSGDEVTLVTNGVSAWFSGRNAGTGLPVAVSGFTLSGGDAGNYNLTQPSGLVADITATPLTITAGANTRTYDGTTSATAIPTISGLHGFDTVSGLVECYDTPNAGLAKTLSVVHYTVNDGNSGSNYAVVTVASTDGVILPAVLTITADNKSKLCGQPNPSLTASYSGFIGGETPAVLSCVPSLNTTATSASAAGTYPITLGGVVAANYSIVYASGTLQVLSAPQLTGVATSVNGTKQLVVSWTSITNQNYQLEYTDSLGSGPWTPAGAALVGNGGSLSVTNDASASAHRFFRLKVQ
ncbi:MAG: YDG domain-containing protein [Verrucomicrobiota bacterium]